MTHPPYLRWTLVGLLIAVSLWVELRPESITTHPYLTRDVPRGESLEGATEPRRLPAGVLDPVAETGYASRDLTAGQPLLAGDLTPSAIIVPPGWWVLDVPVPAATSAGTNIQLVILPSAGGTSPEPIAGLVTAVRADEYESDEVMGSVAFPPERAATAAVAIAEDKVSVLTEAHPTTE